MNKVLAIKPLLHKMKWAYKLDYNTNAVIAYFLFREEVLNLMHIFLKLLKIYIPNKLATWRSGDYLTILRYQSLSNEHENLLYATVLYYV